MIFVILISQFVADDRYGEFGHLLKLMKHLGHSVFADDIDVICDINADASD